MAVTLVTGPVRSGKSRYALELARTSRRRVRYVATAMREADDAEWDARIERHVRERPASWDVVESATLAHHALLDLFRAASEQECVLVDALGTWLSARMATHLDELERNFVEFQARMDTEAGELALAMLESHAEVIVVAEEVGWDIVPVAPSARLFRDVLGRMKQRLACRAERAILVVAGIALNLTALGTPLG